MKKILYTILAAVLCAACQTQKPTLNAISPDGQIEIGFLINNDSVFYYISKGNTPVIKTSAINVLSDKGECFKNLSVVKTENQSVNETRSRVWGKSKTFINNYNQTVIHCKNNLGHIVNFYIRAYNNGAAIRYEMPQADSNEIIKIKSDCYAYNIEPQSQSAIYTMWPSFNCAQEEIFQETAIKDIPDTLIGNPLIIKINDNLYTAISEAEVTDWCCSAFTKTPSGFKSVNAMRKDDSTTAVIAKNQRFSPWKAFMIADNPCRFIESNLIQSLNPPCQIKDVSWIKPGFAAWDWWWCDGYIPDAKFYRGANASTMKYFIDFAAENNWPYQLVDWYWYGKPHFDESGQDVNYNVSCTVATDSCNIEELVKYAAAKNVKLILWLNYKHAQKEMDVAFPLYHKIGVAGVKIDFMNNCDQTTVQFYHRVVKLAAENHLLVDFHGAYYPTGFSYTYPNLITREGVRGNEYNKWSKSATPQHCLMLPFTRMLAGEMDFTPGGFNNLQPEQFNEQAWNNKPSPAVMGTRCFQLAQLIVYESALTVFCESPYNVRGQQGAEFLKGLPATYDNSKVLEGYPGREILIARQKDNIIYVAGMTLDAKEFTFTAKDLNITDAGRAEIYHDAQDTDINPKNLEKQEITIGKETVFKIKAGRNGGFVAKITLNTYDNSL